MVVASGMVLAFALYKLGPAIYPDSHYASRGGLIRIGDIPERILWFARPAASALNFLVYRELYWFWIVPVTAGIFLFISTGPVLYFRGGFIQRSLNCAIAATLVFLSHAVMLVVESPVDDYRALPALTSLIVFYMYLAIQGWSRCLPRFVASNQTAVVAMIAVAFALAAAWQVHRYFVSPQIKELTFIHSQLASENLSQYTSIHVIRPGPRGEFVPAQYAGASSHPPWTPVSMVGFVLRDLAPEHTGLPVTSSAFDDPSPPPLDSLVIDIRKGVSDHRRSLLSIWPFDRFGASAEGLEKVWHPSAP